MEAWWREGGLVTLLRSDAADQGSREKLKRSAGCGSEQNKGHYNATRHLSRLRLMALSFLFYRSGSSPKCGKDS